MPNCINCFAVLETELSTCPQCGYDLENHYHHPLHLPPLSLLNGQYQLGRVLGQGGFGITYIGFDNRLKRTVAIKEFLPASLASRAPDLSVVPLLEQAPAFAKGLHHFIEEARHLARFDHPNIVRVRHYFEAHQTGYMVMDYIKGKTPLCLLRQHDGRLPLNLALKTLFPILDALAIMHAQQVFHLDISAHNVLLLDSGQPILIDFGAARHVNVNGHHTQTLTLMLKPGYSPPEQYHQGSEYIGAWTDVYACAALLYLLLKGKLPPPAMERIQDDKQVQSLNLGKERHEKRVCAAIIKGLSLDSHQRPANVSLFKSLLLPPSQRYSKHYWAYLSSAVLAGGMAWAYLPAPAPQMPPSVSPVMELETPIPPPAIVAQETLPSTETKIDALPVSIDKLLKQADTLQNQQDYAGAYHSYQAVFLLDKDQRQAQAGLARLALEYVNKLTLAPEQNALRHLALSHFPDNPALQAIEKAWQAQQSQAVAAQTQQQKIDNLLAKAQRQFQAQKLTTPVDDNAHQTYLAVLKLQADNPTALAGLEQIAAQYAQWAAQKTDLAGRDVMLRKGLSVVPNHPTLLSLQAKNDSAYVEDLNRRQGQKQKAAQLAELLAKAKAAEDKKDWNLAQRYYQQILLRDDKHRAAKQGLAQLSQHYLKLAKNQRAQQVFSESLLSINQGLAINPKHAQLLSLKQEIQQQLKQIAQPAPPKAPQPAPVVAKAVEKSETSLSTKPEDKQPTGEVMIIPTF